MDAERIKEMRAFAETWERLHNIGTSPLTEAIDEIERLHARKPAPTREQVERALGITTFSEFERWAIVGALSAAGLLAEPEREPGSWWLVRLRAKSPQQQAVSRTWFAVQVNERGELFEPEVHGVIRPGLGFEIGRRIDGPPEGESPS